MKKLLFSVFAIAALVFTGCNNKNDDGGKRRPTPEGETPTASWCDVLFSVSVSSLDTGDYAVAEVDLLTLKSGDQYIWEALEYDSFDEMAEALGDLSTRKAYPSEGELVLYGVDGVTEYDVESPSSTNGFFHWFDRLGSPIAYDGTTNFVFAESIDKNDLLSSTVTLGIMPGIVVSGESYTGREVFVKNQYEDNEIRVGFMFTITIGEVVDEELGKYDPANRKVGDVAVEYTKEISISENTSYDGIVFDVEEVQAAIQLTKNQVNEVLAATVVDEETGELVSGIKVVPMFDGEVADTTGGGICGNWLNKDGESTSYMADDSVLCIELQSTVIAFNYHYCIQPENYSNGFDSDVDEDGVAKPAGAVDAAVGSTFTYVQQLTYIPAEGDEATVVTITHNVTIVE